MMCVKKSSHKLFLKKKKKKLNLQYLFIEVLIEASIIVEPLTINKENKHIVGNWYT